MTRFNTKHISRTVHLLTALLVVVPSLYLGGSANALPILGESLTLGSSEASAVTSHTFSMLWQSASNVGSIELLYCDEGPLHDSPCTPPLGMDATLSVLTSESGETGFTVDPLTTSNRILLSRPPAAAPSLANVIYSIDGIVNPSVADKSHFVRIRTYPTTDATGPSIDQGAVVFSTSGQLSVGGFVPPYLTFCVAIVVSSRCESTTGSLIDLGALDPLTPRFATSQFATATNYSGGYVVYINGTTMTSGTNIIQPNTIPSISNPGTPQFGLNLIPNTDPVVGNLPSGPGTSSPRPDYGIPNLFKYVPGESVAFSDLPSDFDRYTVSYLVNIPEGQAPGRYSTTLQYIAIAQF